MSLGLFKASSKVEQRAIVFGWPSQLNQQEIDHTVKEVNLDQHVGNLISFKVMYGNRLGYCASLYTFSNYIG